MTADPRKSQSGDALADLLGLPPINPPQPVSSHVDTGAMERIRAQISKDRANGLLPKEPDGE